MALKGAFRRWISNMICNLYHLINPLISGILMDKTMDDWLMHTTNYLKQNYTLWTPIVCTFQSSPYQRRLFDNPRFWDRLFYYNEFIFTWILCTMIKWYSKLAKITIFPIHYLPTRWRNRPINDVHVSNLNWRQFFPCQNILYIHFHFIIDLFFMIKL